MAVIQRRATEDFCKCPLWHSALPRSDSSIHYEGTRVGCRSYCDSLRRAAFSHCLSPGRARAFDPIKPIIRTEPLRSCGKRRAISEESSVHNTQMRLNIAAVKVGGCPPPPPPALMAFCSAGKQARCPTSTGGDLSHLAGTRGVTEKLDSH